MANHCPIDGFQNPDHAEKCQQCGADLQVFTLLSTLEVQAAASQSRLDALQKASGNSRPATEAAAPGASTNYRWLLILLGWMLLILTANTAYMWYYTRQQQEAILWHRRQTESLQAALGSSREALQAQTNALENTRAQADSLQQTLDRGRYFQYRVQAGESLATISRKFYGNAAAYTKIVAANPGKISDPNIIFTNWILNIPVE